jgi:prevent-host-death family protein
LSEREVNVRELRNHGGEVLERVARGETLTVTRAGVPIAELRPVPRKPVGTSILLDHWKCLPHVDPAAVRADLDAVLDPSL